ncbi:MAG: FecR domain-containing protein [Myxococcales bacterium]|nr:FecR domain-containing protein [Myxococcales bacterium]
MSLNSNVNGRDVDTAFRVLDGDDRAATANPDALALAASARKQWRQARVSPEQVDFDALDRAVLRSVAEERLRTNERRQVTRVLFPGLGLAAALATIGLVMAAGFGGDTPADAGNPVATVVTQPQTIGVGTRLSSGERPMAATVSVATVNLEPASAVEVLTDEPLLTRVSVGAGSVRFEVAPRPVGGRFEVVAGGATVTVVGTGFRVSRLRDPVLGERVAVVVEHGIVLVRSPDGQTVRLTHGESVTVPANEVHPASLAVSQARAAEPVPEIAQPAPKVVAVEPVPAPAERAPMDVAQPMDAAEVAVHDTTAHPESAPRARALRTSPKPKKVAPPAPAAPPVIVVPQTSTQLKQPAVKAPTSEPVVGTIDMIVETSEDDRLATARLRDLVAGLGPATCSARVSGLRQWIAEQPGHGRLRIGQHALAYCYHALGRTADADRLFRRLGFKLKDILEPKPPAFR